MSHAPWPLPPRPRRADGDVRCVGIEIELQGIPVEDLAGLTAGVLGGSVDEVSTAHFDVRYPDGEPWRVEVDFKLLKELAEKAGPDDAFRRLVVDALGAASSLVVPCEIVSPPLPMDRLAAPLDDLVDVLREAGARGTRHTAWYAFGVHFNVDLPDPGAETLLAYLKAFVCAYDWLVWHGNVDPARRLTPYIDRYPRDYDLLVTDPGYAPDLDRLTGDYLAYNPTRNRALDLLPLLAHHDETRVRETVDDGLLLPRPALHYRLANCSVDEPAWSLRDPWNEWLALERLASDSQALDECCRAFQRHRRQWLHTVNPGWRKEVTRWLTT